MSSLESAATPAVAYPTLANNPDADFERRWTAWKARGLAHERAVRRRFTIVAVATGAIALAAFIGYGLLSS